MTNLTGTEIVNASKIGQISDETKFLDGKTMAEYKSMLINLTDKAISMIPAAIEQSKGNKEDAQIALEEMYRKAVRQTWKTETQYWATMQNGNTGLTQISKDQIGDIIRILCNMIAQA